MKRDNECQHKSRSGDNYGVTCDECGQVLEGYGYGGFFGRNLTGSERCVHAPWYQVGGGGEAQCPYCHEVLKEIT